IKCLISYVFIYSVLQCAISNFNNLDHKTDIKDQSNVLSANQVYSYSILSNFKGFKSLESIGGSSYGIGARGVPGSGKSINEIIISSKYSVTTKFLLIALISCGDIQTNPGPKVDSKSVKRKYVFKLPCSVCGKGVRARPVECSCGQQTHSSCIQNLTNDLYDDFKANNEDIIYKCIFCISSKNKARSNQNAKNNNYSINIWNRGSNIENGKHQPPPLHAKVRDIDTIHSKQLNDISNSNSENQLHRTQGETISSLILETALNSRNKNVICHAETHDVNSVTSERCQGVTSPSGYPTLNIFNSNSENQLHRTQGETISSLILENSLNSRNKNVICHAETHDVKSVTSERCQGVTSPSGLPGLNLQGRRSMAKNEREISSSVNYICQFCKCNVKTKNANILCNTCHTSYHPRCFEKAKVNEKYCNFCILMPSTELPFHDCDENGDIAAVLSDENSNNNINNNNNNNVTPSEAPEDIFDIFKNKGLHFIHINARSMFNKLSEIQYMAKRLNRNHINYRDLA
ncbi:unnamed protein product, partial [Meganyctiphanes norvegica]